MNDLLGSLLTFDPGNRCGWSCFHNGVLTSAGVEDFESIARGETDDGKILPSPTSKLVLVEMPQWRPNETRDITAILKLAVKVGEIKCLYERGLSMKICVELVWPVTWKGSVPKAIHNRRVLSRLLPEELALLPKSPRAKSYDNNMVDAVGLGLWKLGRMHGPASDR